MADEDHPLHAGGHAFSLELFGHVLSTLYTLPQVSERNEKRKKVVRRVSRSLSRRKEKNAFFIFYDSFCEHQSYERVAGIECGERHFRQESEVTREGMGWERACAR